MTLSNTLFVLGGARSGKSRYAQARAETLDGDLIFIATAQAFDDEMVERIARHRSDRGARWSTVEAPIALTNAVVEHSGEGRIVLIDCLTLWTSNLMLGGYDVDVAVSELAAALENVTGRVILVANEVGLGVVPDNAMARQFRDHAGRVNQNVAAIADEVVLIAAGLPLKLK